MKDTPLKFLIIDDHPMIIANIKTTIEKLAKEMELSVQCILAYQTTQALQLIEQSKGIDYVFLDIKLPPIPERQIYSGEDLGQLIKKYHPQAKIIILTVLESKFMLTHLLSKLNPLGILLKSQVFMDQISGIFKQYLQGEPYHSPRVIKALQSLNNSEYSEIDQIDRALLYELSNGTTLTKMQEILPLSRSALAKRKSRLRELLQTETNQDKELVDKAKELGLI